MGKPTTLATAVTATLNAATFSPDVNFTRTLLPIMADEGQSLKGFVFVQGRTFSKLNRCADYEEIVEIGVYIVNTISNSGGLPSDSGIQTMFDLCESIIDHMKTAAKQDGYHLVEVDQPEMFDFSRVYENSIFETTITLRYKGY